MKILIQLLFESIYFYIIVCTVTLFSWDCVCFTDILCIFQKWDLFVKSALGEVRLC